MKYIRTDYPVSDYNRLIGGTSIYQCTSKYKALGSAKIKLSKPWKDTYMCDHVIEVLSNDSTYFKDHWKHFTALFRLNPQKRSIYFGYSKDQETTYVFGIKDRFALITVVEVKNDKKLNHKQHQKKAAKYVEAMRAKKNVTTL